MSIDWISLPTIKIEELLTAGLEEHGIKIERRFSRISGKRALEHYSRGEIKDLKRAEEHAGSTYFIWDGGNTIGAYTNAHGRIRRLESSHLSDPRRIVALIEDALGVRILQDRDPEFAEWDWKLSGGQAAPEGD